ncbi:MAG: hypothetical protein BGO78_16575 [Chloroflexi bacterium 44-23]|nr:MAG: hypothetical protein BGO78_16575 [Chloroflexi bacterium 44-23]
MGSSNHKKLSGWQAKYTLDSIRTEKFSHPSEEMFARILNFYGISWQYEPKLFELEWDKNGKVKLAFAPDFYLPEQDLFIELTTLRPQLASFKNKKIRLMTELYPEIRVKLMKRRDIRDLMVKYGLVEEAQSIRGTASQGGMNE